MAAYRGAAPSEALTAGELDRRLTLQRATVGADALNSPTRTWGTLATVWGSKEPISDGERIAAMERGADITTRFQIRYSKAIADINPKDRVVDELGKTYVIVGVKEIGRLVGFEITATVRTDI